ncbi:MULTISPECIES: sulfite exporter TauE/SafE family protein [Salinivibrio]|uniref:Probable membrane transporter protein n=2 Tax=Salinivibrio TaxID=51366 RepID=A0ABY7LEQ2_9GAMM|nr:MULTISPECIES: sulfite exporter TauE/SafE family protein [Salinivibrio]OOF20311.1 hypothetical protein BZJ17_13595 [Salinivibrio sp. IB574]QIR05828.1 sulfite exporter TauE/SafE family protein [Salinivibrio costicola]WBA15708.1 sulfite exporter TauE/SafE family protein [Salinivibrio proteolyticus]
MADLSVSFAVAVILGLGCFVQSLIGFGMAIVAAPLLLMIDPKLVPTTISMVGLTLASINAWQYRHQLSFRDLSWAYLGRVPGTMLAGAIMLVVTTQMLEIIIGTAVLLAVFASMARLNIAPNRLNFFIAGFTSGVMGTTTSIGGPPMALVLQHAEVNKMRACLAGYFVISCILSLIALGATDYLTWWHVQQAAFAVPAVLLATWLAYRVAPKVKPVLVRRAMLVLCTLAGVSTLVRGLLGG